MVAHDARVAVSGLERAPASARMATDDAALRKANKLPTHVEQKVVGQMRKMAVQTALARTAAAAIAAAQDDVQETLIRQRQASRARFEAVEHLLSEEEKEAWRQMERDTFLAGVNVAQAAAAKIARTQQEADMPEERFAYEDWTWKDNVLDAFSLGTHRLRRQGLAPSHATPYAPVELPGPMVVVDVPMLKR